MSPYVVHALEVQCEGLRAEVWVNGLRVFHEPEGHERFTQKKLNPWLVDGDNTLVLRAALAPGETRRLALRLVRVEGDELPADDACLLSYRWRADEQELGDELTSICERTLALGPMHGPWAWQGAPPYGEADRPALLAALDGLHGCFARADAPGVVERMLLKTEEMSRALDVPAPELESDLREWLRELFSQPDWHMEPLAPEALALVPGANGRVVTVTRTGPGAVLAGAGGTQALTLTELTFTRLPSGFVVVR